MKIDQLVIEQKRLSSAEAELWVVVHVERINPSTQLRGSLVGPRCASAETVQIAYPLKPISPAGHDENILIGRVLIPEPNFWTNATPFVYEGNVELWHEGQRTDIKPIRAMFKTLS
jgi:hypothetical protein